jgi:hypothetical protein
MLESDAKPLIIASGNISPSARFWEAFRPHTKCQYLWFFLLFSCIGTVVVKLIYNAVRFNPHKWFASDLPPANTVANWSEHYLDAHLHELSRWDNMSSSEWVAFVRRSYNALDIPANTSFTFLEIGIGVGAWARIFLREFPKALGEGCDLEAHAIAICTVVLPQVSVKTLNMFDVSRVYANKRFDYVFFPGVVCYAENTDLVYWMMKDMISHDVVKTGSRISLTMIPNDWSDPGSCTTRFSETFWTSLPWYEVIQFEYMNFWHLPHAFGRYAVYLEVRK